jgi:hypothetical protein
LRLIAICLDRNGVSLARRRVGLPSMEASS